MSVPIDKDQCTCDLLKTCKSKRRCCRNIKNKNMHVFNCTRTLCKPCDIFRKYNFICYKMIFMDEPMAFQIYTTELLKLTQLKEIIIKAENVNLTKHCYHSNSLSKF